MKQQVSFKDKATMLGCIFVALAIGSPLGQLGGAGGVAVGEV